MKKQIEGEIYHQIEDFNGKPYAHIGFRDQENTFGDMIQELCPEPGMKRKARLTIELLEDE